MEKNKALLDIIAPMNVKIKKNSLLVGENTVQCLGVIRYPQSADYGWLSKLINVKETIASISFEPIDSAEFLNNLNRNISLYESEEKDGNTTLDRQRAKQARESGETLLQRIDTKGELVGIVSTTIMSIAKNEEMAKKIMRTQMGIARTLGCIVRTLSFRQKEAFFQISPTNGKNKEVSNMLDRVMPLSSIVYGFPHGRSGYTDDDGYYMGMDSAGGLVVVDTWLRSGDRTNSNMVVFGVSGTGKSTAVKHIIINELMLGRKVIVIDPEREYKELCRKFNGNFINTAGGYNKINPLQILVNDEEEDEDINQDKKVGKIGQLGVHLKRLEVFFSLYIEEMDSMLFSTLKDCLIEVYKKFGIERTTDVRNLKNTDYPIMEDLYNYILEERDRKKLEIEQSYVEYEKLQRLLKDIAIGVDSELWNGYTTISADSQLTILDTKELASSSSRIKSTEYYLLSTFIWHEMSKNRTEKVLGIFDEAYLIIDKRVPQTLDFLRETSKRCRKYEGSIIIISHSVIDFLDESVKMYGQALLDLPTYKFIFGSEGENLIQLKNLYSLNDSEVELLNEKMRGHALFCIGSKRLHITFKIPEYEKEYIGEAGGR